MAETSVDRQEEPIAKPGGFRGRMNFTLSKRIEGDSLQGPFILLFEEPNTAFFFDKPWDPTVSARDSRGIPLVLGEKGTKMLVTFHSGYEREGHKIMPPYYVERIDLPDDQAEF